LFLRKIILQSFLLYNYVGLSWASGGIGIPTCAGRRVRLMYFTYIIKSDKYNWFYVGITNNLNKRLKQHNGKKTSSTRKYAPFNLVYSKKFSNRIETRDYEKYLKIRCNKERILKDLKVL